MLSKEKGGLGIINLRLQNDALLMKHLSKFYNRADLPWVRMVWTRYYTNRVPHAAREVGSFWWKDILRLNLLFRGIAKCTIGNGQSVCFWGDIWMNDQIIATKYPRLESFAKSEEISVYAVMQAEDFDSLFMLPFSNEAYAEFVSLQEELQIMEYDEEGVDNWSPIWGDKYSSKRFYSYAFKELDAHPIFKIIWKCKCSPRVKFFAWLILVDRLNTKDMLQRRHLNIQGTPTCVMCAAGSLETIEHLFFECSFAQDCWSKLEINWDLSVNPLDRFIQARSAHQLPFFTEATLIAAWELWKVRNDKVFARRDPTLALWWSNFKSQCLIQSVRFKDDLRSSFCAWLDAFS